MLTVEALHPAAAIAAAHALALRVKYHYGLMAESGYECPLTYGPTDPDTWTELSPTEAEDLLDTWHIETCLLTHRMDPRHVPALMDLITGKHLGMVVYVRTEKSTQDLNGLPLILHARLQNGHVRFDPVRLQLIADMYCSWQLKMMHLIHVKWTEIGS